MSKFNGMLMEGVKDCLGKEIHVGDSLKYKNSVYTVCFGYFSILSDACQSYGFFIEDVEHGSIHDIPFDFDSGLLKLLNIGVVYC